MEIYGDHTLEEVIEHRGRNVEILSAIKGATHCDVEHEYHETVCQACQEEIEPIPVYLFRIDGGNFDIPFPQASNTVEDVLEFAIAYIDELDTPDDMLFTAEGGETDKVGPQDTMLMQMIKKLGWPAKALYILREVGKSG